MKKDCSNRLRKQYQEELRRQHKCDMQVLQMSSQLSIKFMNRNSTVVLKRPGSIFKNTMLGFPTMKCNKLLTIIKFMLSMLQIRQRDLYNQLLSMIFLNAFKLIQQTCIERQMVNTSGSYTLRITFQSSQHSTPSRARNQQRLYMLLPTLSACLDLQTLYNVIMVESLRVWLQRFLSTMEQR